MKVLKFVSVIIVNYNGKHFLAGCLEALHRQTYPSDKFEVIVSDNASKDGSIEFIQTHYPWVRILENQSNLGFASGNNVAIKACLGEFIILLNNDTVPQPGWLENIVTIAEENPDAGLVTGRLLLFYDQLAVTIETDTFIPAGDGRELGIQLYAVDSGIPNGVVQYLDGFYGYEPAAHQGKFRWTKSKAVLGVPVPPGSAGWSVSLQISAFRPGNQAVPIQISLENKNTGSKEILFSGKVSGDQPAAFSVDIPAEARNLGLPLLQNTGSIVFRDGASRDRGTYVRDYEMLYESDSGQHSSIEEVFSGCGANLLLKKAMLEDIGLFDDDFFMYYEDTDLSWRARLQGWKVIYAPDAVVRHIHCGTTSENSANFLYLVERNRLATVIKNGSLSQLVWTLGKYLGRTAINTIAALRAALFRQPGRGELYRWPRHHARVLKTMMLWTPSLIGKRTVIQKRRKINPSTLNSWFVR